MVKIFVIIFLSLFFFYSCSGLNDAKKILRNEKIKTTDEFLVKKRNPLILPPDFETIPKPDTMVEKKESQEMKIKEILKVRETENINNSSSSTEEKILENIRK